MNHEEIAEPLAYEVAFWALAFDEPDYDLGDLGDIALEVGKKLRAIGIYGLLASGDGSLLHKSLVHAGDYRVRYLRRASAERALEQHHFVLGRLDPLFDLIAADRRELVRTLVELSPDEHVPRHEYLDDYCYARVLSSVFLQGDGPADAALDDVMTRYDAWRDGDADVRFELCEALLARDEAAFLDAFDALVAERLDTIEQRRAIDLDDAMIVAERLIYVEGLAVLNVARALSMDVGQPYALCPLSARIGS